MEFVQFDLKDFPMKQFLSSSWVAFHPLYCTPMRDFFWHFTDFCRSMGYEPYKKKYGHLWKQYNISYAKCYREWQGKMVNDRFLLGVQLINQPHQHPQYLYP